MDKDNIRKPIKTEKAEIPTCYINTGYAWNQTDRLITLYLTLENAITISDEQVMLCIETQSIELNIHNHNGKHYKFRVGQLYGAVIPEYHRIRFKQHKIIINLKKAVESKEWTSLRRMSTYNLLNEMIRNVDNTYDEKTDKGFEVPFCLFD
ncbi:hypothetical protein BDB01DRAFT_815125 [Pilobolus umbonatus]|nr:hypothetical protein BDB01DRAFT_815125 [Pilobolus umbonatus]